MAGFAVYLELDHPGDLPEAALDALIDRGEPHGAAWGSARDGHLTVQLTIPANDLHQAADIAFALVPDMVARALNVARPAVNEFEALTEEAFARKLTEPEIPELMSVAQVAEHLNISEQAVRQAAERGRFGAFRVGKSWLFPRSIVDSSNEPTPAYRQRLGTGRAVSSRYPT